MGNETSKVVVLGAAGTGLMMAETISRCDGLAFAGFLDDNAVKQKESYEGHQVLGSLADWTRLPDDHCFVSSLYGDKRNEHYCRLVEGLDIPAERLATVVDPSAVVSPAASLSPGVFVGPLCIVEPQAHLGPLCVLLGGVHVAHHVRLGNYVACANRVSLCGGATVGQASFIGAAACVRQYARVGSGATIGMGSVVISNVNDHQTVAGNPARPLQIEPRP
jgi:sugar O-acyltransferase (sialic acid O-acetyltransferase NeuD family)